jgi:K+-sensing histidine kinase KdpD
VSGTPDLRAEREAFLGVLSHELRTPLTTIYAGSSVLARRPTLSPPATQTLATDINSEAAKLYDLVEDLLVIARLERRILEPTDEAVDVGRAIDGAVRMIIDRYPQARIGAIGTASAPRVRGDSGYVEQACRNLLLASFRAAAEGKAASITILVEADLHRDEVVVRVIDPQSVFGPDDVDHVFELPAAASSGRLAAGGVGLYVARQAVEAMGGRTWAATRARGGIELGFALRIANEDSVPRHASTATDGHEAPAPGLPTP